MVYGTPNPTPAITYSFVPWLAGTDITKAQDPYGFRWFLVPVSFVGINGSGRYLIENNIDGYLLIGDAPQVAEILPGSSRVQVVPPFTAGIYNLNADSFYCTCICAGYEFIVARFNSPSNNAFLQTRGPLARVRVTSLGPQDQPSVQPQLRTGWVRTYDYLDFAWLGAHGLAPYNTLIVGATLSGVGNGLLGGFFDFTGAKSITATVAASGIAASENLDLRLYSTTTGLLPATVSYLLGVNNITSWPPTADPYGAFAVTNNTTSPASTGGIFGNSVYVSFVHNSGPSTITVTDCNVFMVF